MTEASPIFSAYKPPSTMSPSTKSGSAKISFSALLATYPQPAAIVLSDGRLLTANEPFEREISLPENSSVFQQLDELSKDRLEAVICSVNGSVSVDLQKPDCHLESQFKFNVTCLDTMTRSPVLLFVRRSEAVKPANTTKVWEAVESPYQGSWQYNAATNDFYVSESWKRIRGLADDDTMPWESGDWLDNIHPEDRDALDLDYRNIRDGLTEKLDIQYRHRLAHSEKWIWLMCRGSVASWDSSGKPELIIGTDTDITELKSKEAELSKLTNNMQLAIAASEMGVWEFDLATRIATWDDRMLEIYGISDGERSRHEDVWATFLHPKDRDEMEAYSAYCLNHDLDFNRDYRIIRPDGELRYIRSLARFMQDLGPQGKLIGVNIDITADRKRALALEEAKRQLEYDSRHDPLTGLANRRKLDEESDRLFGQLRQDQLYAVMHLDLDLFKQVNDTLGHAAGDAVLKHVSKVLSERAGKDALVARNGGDEFLIVLCDHDGKEALAELANSIVADLSEPIPFEQYLCQIGISIGIAMGQGRPDRRSDIFIHSDIALYAAKYSGRSCYRFYNDSMMDQ